jgi:DNA mismatch endonuclease (patch repair protein)
VLWECQLKPKVREQTLTSLEYTLNHIFLQDRIVKRYDVQEEEERQSIAAEDNL